MTAETTPLSGMVRDPEQYERIRSAVTAELRVAVDRLPESIRQNVGYHLGWNDESGTPTAGTSGKAVRSILAVLCAQAVGGSVTAAMQPAVAVDLVHNFTLLHDDVMDRDSTRRHRPTVWAVFGDGAAILSGDALLMLANEILASSPRSLRLLSAAVMRVCHGQAQDLALENRDEASLDECLTMAANKTGSLLRCACELGALAGGGTEKQIEQLGAFGEHVGLAFQFVDDVLGIWGAPEVTGKPVYSDLVARKTTLPVAAAINANNDAGRAFAELYARNGTLTEHQLETAADLIERSGAYSWVTTQITEQLATALSCLEGAAPTPAAEHELRFIAQLIATRDH